jgi:hypothetical protein
MFAPLLALAAAAQAGMPPGTAEASAALAQCTVAEAQARVSGTEPAEVIADAALAACAQQVRRLADAFGSALGTLSEAERRMLTDPLRDRLVQLINQSRGLVPREASAPAALGECIRSRATAAAARSGPLEALEDLVLQQCRAETDALRASLVRDRGEASANRIMASTQVTLRTLARQLIVQARVRR